MGDTPRVQANDDNHIRQNFVINQLAERLGNAETSVSGALLKANNLSDIANAATALSNLGGAPLASPTFIGDPKAPTPSTGDNDTSISTTAFVTTAFNARSRPYFYARSSTATTLTSGAYTKVQFSTEDLDSDSCYDNATNYRFTPNVAGKYFVFGFAAFATADQALQACGLFFNGSVFTQTLDNGSGTNKNSIFAFAVKTFNGSTDFLECFVFNGDSVNRTLSNDQNEQGFGAFRID